ncbi:MAG: hypothetical protein ABGX03_03875 [Methylophilaceae bacterium]
MNPLVKIIIVFFILIQAAQAENQPLSGVVTNIDSTHHTIMINSYTYKIKPSTRIYGTTNLKAGSVVDYTVDDDSVIKQLEIRPGLQIMLPPRNN